MPTFLRGAGANLDACRRGVRRNLNRLYRRVLGRDDSPQRDEDVQQRGRVANPLVILVVEILATDFSVSKATVAQLALGFVYGVSISTLHLLMDCRTRLRTVLTLAGVVPAAVYLFPGGPTLHVVPMIIVSAAAGTQMQHCLHVRNRQRTFDSVLRPQSSVECLLVAWLIAVGGNAKQVSHFIQAGAVLFFDVLSSSIATRSLTTFFLRVVLVTLALASLVQQFVPASTPKNLGRRGEVAGSSQGQEGWPRAEVLAVIGFFVTPGIAMFYKDEDEENSGANGFLPLENNELPVWVNIEEELRAGVEQWKD
ncbi:hypothetical protein CTAM01_14878 [Colletotrichum tamarilloi]|uniref:Uncharacterized protein n=1 Tax=Colletotrichum tamarilloi TaxID=1209934 RepID=A0ABQ9QN25_9PEZI|nr:uncharacterized protein CTAM01_14878 [Colletotrichum tamarilloi]KAK1479014.1 hypothetical protein CTAM01_14878 [Colletotrichum tamarilloi]